MKIPKILWTLLGCVGLALGAVGAVLPMLPAFPFLLLAAFSFARSSPRLHRWFIGTQLYQQNLNSFVQGRGMSRQAKQRVIATVTALMGFGFLMMFLKELYLPCGILFGVWILHLIYFGLIVKNPREEKAVDPQIKTTR